MKWRKWIVAASAAALLASGYWFALSWAYSHFFIVGP